jgi:hypothetical protein
MLQLQTFLFNTYAENKLAIVHRVKKQEQDRQCQYNVILWRVLATIVAVETQ